MPQDGALGSQLQVRKRLAFEVEPGWFIQATDGKMCEVAGRPIVNGDWVCVPVRDEWERSVVKLWFRRDVCVVARTAEDQEDLIEAEFGFRPAPRRTW